MQLWCKLLYTHVHTSWCSSWKALVSTNANKYMNKYSLYVPQHSESWCWLPYSTSQLLEKFKCTPTKPSLECVHIHVCIYIIYLYMFIMHTSRRWDLRFFVRDMYTHIHAYICTHESWCACKCRCDLGRLAWFLIHRLIHHTHMHTCISTAAVTIMDLLFMILLLKQYAHTYIYIYLHTYTWRAALMVSVVFLFMILLFRPYALRAVNFLQAYAIFCQAMTIMRESSYVHIYMCVCACVCVCLSVCRRFLQAYAIFCQAMTIMRGCSSSVYVYMCMCMWVRRQLLSSVSCFLPGCDKVERVCFSACKRGARERAFSL